MTGSDATTLKVYDALGRLVTASEGVHDVWAIPTSLANGTYRLVLTDWAGRTETKALVIER